MPGQSRRSTRRREVEELQRETRDGVAYLEESGDPDLSANVDATEAVDRARLGGVLTGKELLEVADSLEVLGRARTAFARNTASAPVLAEIASGIPDLLEVQRQVGAKIGIRGEVLDSATPTLGALRRSVRASYQRAVEALERVMRSPVGEDALQDNVISVRSDRLVLQVRTELRHKVPGIVHDVSRTDATLFVEPFATVDACNTWRELSLEEDQETRRVLMELSELVGAVADDIRIGMRLTARLDFIMARARYSARLNGVPVHVGDDHGDSPLVIQLVNARHPLLGNDAVPVSVGIGAESSVLVITGPNTGGKTVSMKTVGLLALMHQTGLYVPAEEGSILPIFDGVYADVGDQQSIAGSVSTFSSHMLNVIEILDHATTKSLVLLDELGTSTDPEEGSALAKAVLRHLATKGVKTVVTTHHRTVAAFAEASSRMMNASVDLEPNSLRPTYHLTMGVPGRSYAMSVARSLGLPEQIMDEAARLLEPQYMQFEDWLDELQSQRMQLKTMLQDAEKAKRDAESATQALEAELRDVQSRREDMLADHAGGAVHAIRGCPPEAPPRRGGPVVGRPHGRAGRLRGHQASPPRTGTSADGSREPETDIRRRGTRTASPYSPRRHRPDRGPQRAGRGAVHRLRQRRGYGHRGRREVHPGRGPPDSGRRKHTHGGARTTPKRQL